MEHQTTTAADAASWWERRLRRPPTVGLGTLRQLGHMETHGAAVLSVYVDLEPREQARTAAPEREMEHALASLPSAACDRDERVMRKALRSMPSPTRGTRSLALFSTAEGSAFTAIALPESVETMAVLDMAPWLEPLAATFTCGDWGVAVLARGDARLFRGGPRALVEFATVREELHPMPATGARPRIDRRYLPPRRPSEQAPRVAELFLRAHRRQPFTQLAAAGEPELCSSLKQALHGDLCGRFAGVPAGNLEEASAGEIAALVGEAMEVAVQSDIDGIETTRRPPMTRSARRERVCNEEQPGPTVKKSTADKRNQ